MHSGLRPSVYNSMEDNFDAKDSSTFEMKLKEDVAAELEEFILLSRLAVHDEAMDIAEHILWRHLQIFPVMAEISGCLIEQRDFQRLRRLVRDLDCRHIRFTATDEADFIELLRALSDRPNPATTRVSQLPIKYANLILRWYLIEYNSPVQASHSYAVLLICLTSCSSRSQKSWLQWPH